MAQEHIEIWGVNDPNISAQLALAYTHQLFEREAGLHVSCKFIESGTTMDEEVLSADKRPFAFTQTPITALLLHEKGVSTKLVAPLADIAATQQVIARQGISTPKDIEGKRIGMAQGAAVYLALENMAKDCNVDLNQVSFSDLLPHDQLEAFKSGDVDVIASWAPWTTKAQNMGGSILFSGTQSQIPGMEGTINWLNNQSCLIVPDEHLEQQPDIVIAILRVLRKATDFINTYRKHVANVLAGFFGINELMLLTTMRENTYSLAMTNLFRMAILSFRDFLYERGQISSKFPERVLYDTSFLRQVDHSLVTLGKTETQDIAIIEEEGIYYREDLAFYSGGPDLDFLVADDSKFMRTALVKIIKKIQGRVVGEATTGNEIIERFANIRPDVITMDLSMPGMSGIEAIKTILQIDPNVTIIVISGMNLQEIRKDVFNLGVKMFIIKPFDVRTVTGVFTRLFSPPE